MVKGQKDRKVSEGDQEVLEPRKKSIKGVKGEFLGGGGTHQINGECKRNESSPRRSSVTFKRSFWKVVEMGAE